MGQLNNYDTQLHHEDMAVSIEWDYCTCPKMLANLYAILDLSSIFLILKLNGMQ